MTGFLSSAAPSYGVIYYHRGSDDLFLRTPSTFTLPCTVGTTGFVDYLATLSVRLIYALSVRTLTVSSIELSSVCLTLRSSVVLSIVCLLGCGRWLAGAC